MKQWLRRSMLSLAIAGGAVGVILPTMLPTAKVARADSASPATAVDQLKAQALKLLRAGQFHETSELLAKAAETAPDKNPAITQMAGWSSEFEAQRQGFVAERHKQFDKSVGEVKTLSAAHKDLYVIDYARTAYLLSDDKKAFRAEPWMQAIVDKSVALAAEYEQKEQWMKALRLYSDLSSLDPASAEWKDKLKLATRRIRLLALYTPDQLKVLQDAESKEREEADALVHPTTKPTGATLPTTKPAIVKDPDNDSFKIDWHEALRGVTMPMLYDGLADARVNYYREVALKDMMVGGLNGIRAIATTKGLEKAFPKLADDAKRQDFLTQLDALVSQAKDAVAGSENEAMRRILARLQTANNNTIQIDEPVLVSEFADGAFAELDPFTNMIWPNDLDEFNKATQGEFHGVGIQIQSDDDGSLKVVSPLEESPAYRAGIKAGDIIAAINGKNAKGISTSQAVKNITGPAGTFVTLSVRHPDHTTQDYTLRRETIKVASIKGWSHKPGGGWDYMIDKGQKIGYIRLTNFTKNSGEELVKACDEMNNQGVRAVILDLRYNPGGLLTAAIDVCDKFLKGGVIVSTHADRETPNPPTVAKAKNDGDQFTKPLVVLVNQYSASASEIVSGALKDDQRATIIGERTFGKGSVQMLFPLAERRAYLKLTTSHYYLPSGRCIHREETSPQWGVDPDVTVEMTPEQMRVAIDARQELDVLRAAGEKVDAPKDDGKADPVIAKAKKDPLSVDAQLSAALLLLRLQLTGEQL